MTHRLTAVTVAALTLTLVPAAAATAAPPPAAVTAAASTAAAPAVAPARTPAAIRAAHAAAAAKHLTRHQRHKLHQAHLRQVAARTERALVVKAAERYIGRWYVYGVLDCSGLTQHAYAAVGKHLPRTAAEQGRVGYRTTHPRPGDLVVWSSHGVAYHVGVYIGRARAVVARHTGTRVGVQVINWGHPTYRVVLT